MDLALRVEGREDGRYRGRLEVGGVSVYTTKAAYGSKREAREASIRLLAEALGALMAEHDIEAGDE